MIVKPHLKFSSFFDALLLVVPIVAVLLLERMISLEASEVTWNYPWKLSLDSEILDPFSPGSWIKSMVQTHPTLFPWSHHVSLHRIAMDISFTHSSFIIIMHCIRISHCIFIHLICCLSQQLHIFCCHYSHASSPMHDPDIYLFMPCILQCIAKSHNGAPKLTLCSWLHALGTMVIAISKPW